MKPLQFVLLAGALIMSEALTGCSSNATKSPDVAGPIRQSLNNSGLKDVSVSQDRDKGVVTLTGHVGADAEKTQAESVTKALAQDQVVANEIVVTPRGVESEARDINSDVDKGIRSNLDAALIQNGLNKIVKYDVKNGVITLTGAVESEVLRGQAARIAASIPYKQQVVNELQVRNQKATAY